MTDKIKKFDFYFTTEINLESPISKIFGIQDFFSGTDYAVFSSDDYLTEADVQEEIDTFISTTIELIDDKCDAFVAMHEERNQDYYAGYENTSADFEDDEMARFIMLNELTKEEIFCLTIKVKRSLSYYDYDTRILH